MTISRQQARKLERQTTKQSERVTPKSSALAFRKFGRTEGVAQGMELAARQIRGMEASYVEACLAYLEGLDDCDVRWGYVATVRPVLDGLLDLANQFEGLAGASAEEAKAYAHVAQSLITALDGQMRGSMGRKLGKRAVAAARVLAGTPPGDVG